MLISKEMYLFLKGYLKWVENGAINLKPYHRATGLCTAAHRCKIPNMYSDDLWSELIFLFEAEGLDTDYPFGKNNYLTRFHNDTQYLDPLRLKWIKTRIEEYENALVTA